MKLTHLALPILLCSLLFSLLFSLPVFASITVVSTRTEKSAAHHATFIELKKEVVLPGAPATEISYLTDIRFGYEVGKPSQIENYAIVQWIRGCMFSSEYTDGHVDKDLSITRKHFGKTIVFQHKDWQIDSDSTDPIYSSDPTHGRFAFLRWNADKSILDADNANVYAKLKPPHGSVFVTDMPGSGFLASGTGRRDGTAQNASLQYITCLFKTSGLPTTTTPQGTGIDRTKSLWCVNWDHQFVWNFEVGRMSQPAVIDPVCDVVP